MNNLFQFLKIWLIELLTFILYLLPTFITLYLSKKEVKVCDNCGIINPKVISSNPRLCQHCQNENTVGKITKTPLRQALNLF